MAAEVSSMPVNGNYAPHQGYGGLEQQNNYAYAANMPAPSAAAPAAPPSNASSAPPSLPSKDEVGWYFVEQYYTTLSRNPEKVYLFYNKRSQFVSGQETDKVAVCVGQRAINDRIKELEFQDTKVRVTNVDSQASDSNIVIQVIGEISNKSQPHRKFVQTFILATQTNGYFVLNDIFRYLIDEEDEPEQEAAAAPTEEVQQAPAAESGYQEPPPTAGEAEPKTLTSSANPAEVESDAQKVDKELEEQSVDKSGQAKDVPAAVNGVAPAADESKPSTAEPAAAEITETKEAEPQSEKPVAPEPTPAASPPKQAPAQPAPAPKPAAPAVPKTWASLAASANKAAPPAAPSSSASSQTSQQPKQAAPTKPAAPTAPAAPSAPAAPTAPTAPAAQRDQSPAASSQDEWTAVGSSHNRQQSRQANQQQQQGPQLRSYISKVYEAVKEDDLRAHLSQYGELTHCDISRQKNCAWVDFKTPEGYNAALAANPHVVNGERLYIEERRPRPGQGAYASRGQYQGRGGTRGGAQGGRGNPQGGRGNFQGSRGGRGGAAPRGGATSQHL